MIPALMLVGGTLLLVAIKTVPRRWFHRPRRPHLIYRCHRCTHVSDNLEDRADHMHKAHVA